MLGYSVSGYGELSFIPKSVVRKADELEAALCGEPVPKRKGRK